MDYATINQWEKSVFFDSSWTDITPTKTIEQRNNNVSSNAASAPNNAIVAVSSNDPQKNCLMELHSKCPDAYTLITSVYLPILDNIRLSSTSKAFHQLFFAFALKSDISTLPNKQQYWADQQSTFDYIFSSTLKIIWFSKDESEDKWTPEEAVDEFPQHVKDQFLPFSVKGTEELEKKGLHGFLIKHHLANGKDTVLSLYSKHQQIHKELKAKDFTRGVRGWFDRTKLLRVLSDCIVVGLLENVDQAVALDGQVKEVLCFEDVQKALVFKKITMQALIRHSDILALKWELEDRSSHPKIHVLLSFKDVFDHPRQVQPIRQNEFILNIIKQGRVDKSEFLSLKLNALKALKYQTVQKGWLAKDFSLKHLEQRADMLDWLFDPPVYWEYYHGKGKYAKAVLLKEATQAKSCPVAYYFKKIWKDQLTLGDCLTADRTKINILLDEPIDIPTFGNLVRYDIVTVKQLLDLPTEKLRLIRDNDYTIFDELIDGKLSVDELNKLSRSDLRKNFRREKM